jgi:ketosteroid isomerase-like protein
MNAQTVKFARALLPLLTAALVSPLLTGCATRNDGALPNDVTTALASAFTRGDVEACAALYSDDAAIMSDIASVHGKQAITKFFKDQVAQDILFSTDSTVSVVHGDLAMDQGTYRIRNVNRGVDVEYGEYLNVWRLQNGQWRVFRSMYNVTMSPGGAVSIGPDDDDLPIGPPSSS